MPHFDNKVTVFMTAAGESPSYETKEAAGADIKARVGEPVSIGPGKAALIPTGIRLALPEGYEAQIRPRSGLALKHSVTVLNTPGTIDSDYRGEVGVILVNHGERPFVVTDGMRVAQMVIAPVLRASFVEVGPEQFETLVTERGRGGFGSTGMEKK